jgi:hypothetical protein
VTGVPLPIGELASCRSMVDLLPGMVTSELDVQVETGLTFAGADSGLCCPGGGPGRVRNLTEVGWARSLTGMSASLGWMMLGGVPATARSSEGLRADKEPGPCAVGQVLVAVQSGSDLSLVGLPT